jgi:hypothetical protein
MYAIASVLIEDYARRPVHERRAGLLSDGTFRQTLADVSVDERAYLEERAAILEHDGRLDRDAAQRKSMADWLAGRR